MSVETKTADFVTINPDTIVSYDSAKPRNITIPALSLPADIPLRWDHGEIILAQNGTKTQGELVIERSSLLTLTQIPDTSNDVDQRLARKPTGNETLFFINTSIESGRSSVDRAEELVRRKDVVTIQDLLKATDEKQTQTPDHVFIDKLDGLLLDNGYKLTIPSDQRDYTLSIQPRIDQSHLVFLDTLERAYRGKEYQGLEYLAELLTEFSPKCSFSAKELSLFAGKLPVFILDNSGIPSIPNSPEIENALYEDPWFPTDGSLWTGNHTHPIRINLAKPPYFFETIINDTKNPNRDLKLVLGVRFSGLTPKEIHKEIKDILKQIILGKPSKRTAGEAQIFRPAIDPYIRAIDRQEVEKNFYQLIVSTTSTHLKEV